MKCKICGKEFIIKSNSHSLCDDCKKKKCKRCGKTFLSDPRRNAIYCSMNCYHKARWNFTGKCKTCGKPVESKAVYCCDQCRKDYWNKNDYQIFKKKRIWKRKTELIEKLGGKCVKCGISDIRVLDINHKDRNKKVRPKDGKYSWHRRFKEWDKNIKNLELLCANCHRIHTWNQMGYGKF
jgi:hypothetical protein